MNWNFINSVLLGIICFFVISIFLLDISFNMSWKASITDWLSVFIYACTLLVAVFAGLIAKKALNENQRMANDNQRLVDTQTEPFVDISLEIMPQSISWIRLKIQNLGLSSAFNIKFTVKEINPENDISQLVINQFFGINFMTQGLSYLSKGDSRHTPFINLFDSVEDRGFTIDEFLNTKFTIEITFEDVLKKKYLSKFNIVINEIHGTYRIGDSFEDQLIKQMKSLNTNLIKINDAQTNFHAEYEKTHRNWTEQELELKLNHLKKNRKIREYLGLPAEDGSNKK